MLLRQGKSNCGAHIQLTSNMDIFAMGFNNMLTNG